LARPQGLITGYIRQMAQRSDSVVVPYRGELQWFHSCKLARVSCPLVVWHIVLSFQVLSRVTRMHVSTKVPENRFILQFIFCSQSQC